MRMAGIFDGMDQSEIDKMLQCFSAVVRRYKAGASILSYSGTLSNVCVVLSGSVEVVCTDAEGNGSIVETLEEGAVFGEIFSLPVGSLAYTVAARSTCEVLFIRYECVIHPCERLCAHHSRLVNNLFMLSAQKSQRLSRRIAILSQRTLRQKLLLYLEYMAAETGSNAFELSIPLSRLADYLSADRSAMMRELGRMREDGLIRSSGRRFELLTHGAGL